MPTAKSRCTESLKLLVSVHVCCCSCWKNSHYANICFTSVKLASVRSYHLHICNGILLWSWKLLWSNRHVNRTIFEICFRSQGWLQWDRHVNRMTFQSHLCLMKMCSKSSVCGCKMWKFVIGGGELTRNINQKKTSGILQACRTLLSDECCRYGYFFNKQVEYCE